MKSSTSLACLYFLYHILSTSVSSYSFTRGILSKRYQIDSKGGDNNKIVLKAAKGGDQIREATGIRPSLYPTIINAISEGLHRQAKSIVNKGDIEDQFNNEENIATVKFQVASAIALESIMKRESAVRDSFSSSTGEKLDMNIQSEFFTEDEKQLVAGRVVGVLMRLSELDELLWSNVSKVPWVSKYGEFASFGLISDSTDKLTMQQRLKDDPLLRMSKAECLLALFLVSVECPQFEKLGMKALDGGKVEDFIDSERLEVILQY